MYIPQQFEITEREELLAFIAANAFGQLVSSVKGRLFSSHIPFLLSGDGNSLICHVAKNNPQWEALENQEVLAVFQGPHGYISPSWYGSPGVPTWNYQAVHVYGKPELISDENELKELVKKLTEKYESTLQEPWKPVYKDSLLHAIVGIQIEISEIQGKYKLSQNRPEKDRSQVIKELESMGSTLLSKAMKNTL